MNEHELPKLLTIREVAEIVGTSTRTVQRWVDDGEFPMPLRAGRRLLLWAPDPIEARIGRGGRPTANRQKKEA